MTKQEKTNMISTLTADQTATNPLGLKTVSSQKPVLRVILSPAQQTRVAELATQKRVETMAPNDIAMFGSERQVVFSQALNELLSHITKESSPVLFQLFKELKSGADKADIGKLEQDIRKSLETTWFQKLIEMVPGSGGVMGRLERVNRRIGNSLTAKTTSLLDLMTKMEGTVNTELQRLIQDANVLDTLAREFIKNGEEFGVSVEAGRAILQAGKERSKMLTESTGGDLMKVQEAKDFERKVQLFESRCIILETAYVKSFSSLDMVGLAKGASITTIAETANSVLSEFTDIKENLVQLSLSYRIKGVQALGAARRDLRNKLQEHGTTVLNDVATTAARMQGDNRLEDAQLLATLVTNLKQIGNSVETEHKNNEQKFAEARNKLIEAQASLSEVSKKA